MKDSSKVSQSTETYLIFCNNHTPNAIANAFNEFFVNSPSHFVSKYDSDSNNYRIKRNFSTMFLTPLTP